MTTLAVIFFSLLALSTAKYPGKLYREEWGNRLMALNLLNLTLIMCKDANVKLRHASNVQEEYTHSVQYELGMLAAGISDKFKHMLRIYRYYSDAVNYKKNKYGIGDCMKGYQVMQGLYTELRVESELFHEIVNQQRDTKSGKDKELEEFAKKHPGMDIEKLKEARDKGLIPPGAMEDYMKKGIVPKSRRSMSGNQTQINGKPQNGTDWNKKKEPEELAYKKKLRYIMWAEKWKGFNPDIEGVQISHDIAKAGLENASDFSLKEFANIF